MISVQHLKQADSQSTLRALVNQAAEERNCELDSSTDYIESAEWYEQEAPRAGNGRESQLELAAILRAADARAAQIYWDAAARLYVK